MLQKFILNLLVEAAKNPEVREFVADQISRLADKLKTDLLPDMLPKITALIPLAVGAAVKNLGDHLNINLPELPEIVEGVRETVNHVVPDIDIPIISDVVKNVTGFDLTDFIRNSIGKAT